MPQYTYICKECKHRFTITKGINDPSPDCEKCQSEVYRDYSEINIDMTTEQRDPNSARYWQKGKTTDQISKAIEGKTNPY